MTKRTQQKVTAVCEDWFRSQQGLLGKRGGTSCSLHQKPFLRGWLGPPASVGQRLRLFHCVEKRRVCLGKLSATFLFPRGFSNYKIMKSSTWPCCSISKVMTHFRSFPSRSEGSRFKSIVRIFYTWYSL